MNMKKVLLGIVLAVAFSLGVQAQTGEKSAVFQAGYQSDPGRLMIGVEGRYNITNNIRIAPDVLFLFPKNKVTGLDIDINAHYVFPLESNVSVFPLAGLAMLNGRYSGETIAGQKFDSRGFTNWGFNLGGGVEYNLSSNTFLNLEMKYTFSDADCFTVGFGYGIKF
jgi:opacity protein-like surface antigen